VGCSAEAGEEDKGATVSAEVEDFELYAGLYGDELRGWGGGLSCLSKRARR
jgi:hypothetical protein